MFRAGDDFREEFRKIAHRDLAVRITDVICLTRSAAEQYFEEARDCVRDIAEGARLCALAMYGNLAAVERLVGEHRDNAAVVVSHAGTIHIEGTHDLRRNIVML